MNKRIQELMAQAYNELNVVGPIEDKITWQEKFAELLIRECADLVDNNDDSYPYVSFGDMIKQHFGIPL
jgi:hypothetical protein